MFEAFILGFWIIWSSGRNVRAVSEGLGFTIIAILVRQLSAFDMPMIDTYWMVFNGALWAFASAVFYIIGRFSGNFMTSCVFAAIAGVGYFQLLQHLPKWVHNWLA